MGKRGGTRIVAYREEKHDSFLKDRCDGNYVGLHQWTKPLPTWMHSFIYIIVCMYVAYVCSFIPTTEIFKCKDIQNYQYRYSGIKRIERAVKNENEKICIIITYTNRNFMFQCHALPRWWCIGSLTVAIGILNARDKNGLRDYCSDDLGDAWRLV